MDTLLSSSQINLFSSGQINFTPDPLAKVHQKGAINLLCKAFASHEAGLPEWVKNANDMYRRSNSRREDSVIVVLFRNGTKNRPSLVGCLDFGGMTVETIEGSFNQWADPNAAAASSVEGVEGGHGNGGKCYMTQMFEEGAYLHTVTDGRGSRYGFVANDVRPAYLPDPARGRKYVVDDPLQELNAALQQFGITAEGLPDEARRAFDKSQGFTLVIGVGAKGYEGRLPVSDWLNSLKSHQQTIRAIQRNLIFVLHSGRLLNDRQPLNLPEITPLPGAESGRTISVPAVLKDPETDLEVQTGATAQSRLELSTSNVSMRHSLKARHTINGWTETRRATGYWEVYGLTRSGYANKIYGDVYLDALEGFKQNDRHRHAEAPLTRALREWLREQVEAYSAEFVKLDRLEASQQEKDELSRMNEALDRWKNSFLDQKYGGMNGSQPGPGPGPKPKPRPVLPRGQVASVQLRLTHTKAGCGMSFRPSIDFFDEEGKRVRPVPFEWEVSDYNVAFADADIQTISTFAPGEVDISIVCKDTGLRSNVVSLEVLDLADITLAPSTLEIAAGSKAPIQAIAHTRDGRDIEGIYLIWTESDPTVVSVGSSGMAYGLQPGNATIAAGDDRALSTAPVEVTVTERVEDGEGGSGYPRILLSEIDDDPIGLADGPPKFSVAEAPVHQRVHDVEHNLWWINMASPLARRYLDSAKGEGPRSREWRVYMLERYIEVMIKIVLTYDYEGGEELSFETILSRWEEEASIMQARAADTLSAFLDDGDLTGIGE